jgi:hypothetical protein
VNLWQWQRRQQRRRLAGLLWPVLWQSAVFGVLAVGLMLGYGG